MIRLILIICLTIAIIATSYHKTDLKQNWKMEVLSGPASASSVKGKVFDTNIPTTVHLDL